MSVAVWSAPLLRNGSPAAGRSRTIWAMARRWTPNRVIQALAVVFFALSALVYAGIITGIGPGIAWLAAGLAAYALAGVP